ncbi:hypothetical protein AX774_g5893 [Zancudomyces culisetae]|uniref:SPX domain-containing protein n=1 Tax=Zancudomyces culisetae TaxID=1213189 RepID=A0A1R1PI89_ZANCU|nr:hypothetical protein AX774_g5893 [Zancudomyces culisetae]|eukprot:OMH80658.1 hypothetical protein AX774_g5893 [Zancudomyces culisetae]
MKFGKYIESEAVPEWHTKYLNYKLLKKCLKRITATKKDLTGESVPILPIGLELEYGSHRVGGENSSIQGTRGNYLMNTAKPSKAYQSTQHIHGHGFLSEVPDVKGSNEYEAWLHREESNVSASLPRDLERSFGGRRIHSRENLAKENQMGNTSTSGVSSAVVGELEPAKDSVRRRINSMSEKNATSGKRDEAVVVIKKNSTRYSPEHVYKMYASEEMFYNALDMRSLGEQEFFRLVNEELQKINSFYREKEELFYTRFVAICNQLEILRHKIQENAFSKALGSEKKKSLEFSKGKKVLWTIKSMIEEALKVSEKENNEEAKQKTDVSGDGDA